MGRSGTRSSIALPNLIVIGAMKSGTSSLHYYLDAHPDIAMARVKELNFFSLDRIWAKGIDWYAKQFDPGSRIRGESSPSYSKFPHVPAVPERMATIVPDAKLIYLVRDPIDRAVSHYLHVSESGRDDRKLNEALSQFERNPYLDCSSYSMQLDRYLGYFPPSRILVVQSEALKTGREETLRRIFRFLSVDDSIHSARHTSLYHVSGAHGRLGRALTGSRLAKRARPYIPRAAVAWAARRGSRRTRRQPQDLDPSLREKLAAYFADDVARLHEMLREEFVPWPTWAPHRQTAS
jgi:hypothetical protein